MFATLVIVMLILWVCSVFQDDSCDCCYNVTHLQQTISELEDDIYTLNMRLANLEERNGLSNS